MRTMFLTSIVAGALSLGSLTAAPANALPGGSLGAAPLAGSPDVTLVSGGCGPFAHRGFYGHCRPNGVYRTYGFYRPYGFHRYGWHRRWHHW